jgi:hypothetical protein
MVGGAYARVVAVAVAAGAAILGFPALSGAATAIVRPASRSRRPSMRHPRGHHIRRARQLRRARNCLPGQSGADVRVAIAKDGISLIDLVHGRRQVGCRPVGAAPLKCAVCGTVVSWPNGKAAASQTCPVRWPSSRPLDTRTGRSVPLAHDEPGIDRQRVFGDPRACCLCGGHAVRHVTLLPVCRCRCAGR